MTWSVVVPTVGRPSLDRLLASLAAQRWADDRPGPERVVVVDDRPFTAHEPLRPTGARVVRTGGRGPAAARNAGWRSVTSPWVVFLDDDVLLPDGWGDALHEDLAHAAADVAGSQARLHVPLPDDRPPTDWERSTAGLERARWATADMAYRRDALAAVGGFDERFPRAYREDADLALRVRQAGWRLERGRRTTHHPVRPADAWVSVRVQRGNADDALLRARYGPGWRELTEAGTGRFVPHVATSAAALATLGGAALRRRPLTVAGAVAWLALTADLTGRRLRPGPGPGDAGWPAEWARMVSTSLVLPVVAVVHRLRGEARWRGAAPAWPRPVRALLLDRDGTLVHDVPYNGDPDAVRPVDGAREVLDRVRAAGIRVGLVSNQSGVARGLLTSAQVDAVNARVAALLGPFDVVRVCPHAPEDGCACRKPAPGMVLDAAAALGVAPWECAVVGDIGADLDAAVAAGARGVLVPTPSTRPAEVAAAAAVGALADDLDAAVRLVLPVGAP
ncbi:HAD-IIIA family hydrolase [Cellulomonas fimi]|uniref:D,D-heptose 1,7-bisphosphate phosphatase n=1 Tax=Cellulomonas fimi (strain ATCC 484 / DSM 20113 / JCM 1341 / CCUG 24087 / LMG 16345 / NBRC 15513 / NCIMB 8980 / NCTC 7547 / NRS-133) TaxID=590998 RepID=F4H5Y7_CELFA|nr:hydrolase, HAD-superfamily, subfamily IIIA [Cellulomonas fimi ATCC 484]VEH33973.1 D,D-heptose 1,7-bisphosphate phosphatase [Cellulomonas fimi]